MFVVRYRLRRSPTRPSQRSSTTPTTPTHKHPNPKPITTNQKRRKLNEEKVDEDTRATVRAFCNGLVTALNKYYAFGSVFAEEL
jgi:hypothetical protein